WAVEHGMSLWFCEHTWRICTRMAIRVRWFNVCMRLGKFSRTFRPWTSTSKRYSAEEEALLLSGTS
ncbi:hypothetical protein STEG23_015955, partial [Scotinomys teguina]